MPLYYPSLTLITGFIQIEGHTLFLCLPAVLRKTHFKPTAENHQEFLNNNNSN